MTGLRNSTDATFLGLLVPITLLGAALRFAFLGAQAPSIDEGWSVGAVLGGFDHMVEVVSRDTHPPLYFFLQWLQVDTLGPGLATDRLVAAAFGTAAVPITMLVARRVSAGAFPTFAGLLVAVSPLALFTSRDARPHVAAATLALAATWLLLRALERPAWLRLGAYAAAAAGTVLTSYAGIAVLAAHALAACALRPSGPGRWVTTGGGAMLLCLPWLLFAAPQLLRAGGILFSDPSAGPGGHLIEFLRVGGYALTGGFSLVDEFNPWLAALVLLPVGTGLFFGKGLRPRSMIPSFPLMGEGESERDATGATNDVLQAGSQRPVTLVVLLVVLTTLVFFAVTSALGGQFVARYLTPLVAPLAVLYALAVWRLPRPSRAVAAAILLLGWSWTSIDVLTRDKA
ncbi:MAG: glycosyltransferase family 39 protein, partial [Chloroflexi bacterium]|nr:glycosyltransferase family 39 protein [Chloroflexota bacterium]